PAKRDAGHRFRRHLHPLSKRPVLREADNLPTTADDCDPDAPVHVDSHPVGHSFGEPREDLTVTDRAIRAYCVGPHSMRSRITMVEELPIWTEAQPVGDLDAFPQFRHCPRRIDAEERSR